MNAIQLLNTFGNEKSLDTIICNNSNSLVNYII